MISFSNINKQYGKQLLFVDASFQLNPGEKVGLVGPNGSGKTTLFRMVVGEETPDEGAVSVPKKMTIGYFRQDVEKNSLHNPRWCEDCAGGLIGVGSFAARLKPCPPHDVVLACDIVPGHVGTELPDRTRSFDRHGRRRRLG